MASKKKKQKCFIGSCTFVGEHKVDGRLLCYCHSGKCKKDIEASLVAVLVRWYKEKSMNGLVKIDVVDLLSFVRGLKPFADAKALGKAKGDAVASQSGKGEKP